uniref:Uncharacterized protein n=1 Tax=Opuntia streptacantha TaxID=393608 RepID=A0A7C9D6F6_OPUST
MKYYPYFQHLRHQSLPHLHHLFLLRRPYHHCHHLLIFSLLNTSSLRHRHLHLTLLTFILLLNLFLQHSVRHQFPLPQFLTMAMVMLIERRVSTPAAAMEMRVGGRRQINEQRQ